MTLFAYSSLEIYGQNTFSTVSVEHDSRTIKQYADE